jgi:hypothetical protein
MVRTVSNGIPEFQGGLKLDGIDGHPYPSYSTGKLDPQQHQARRYPRIFASTAPLA